MIGSFAFAKGVGYFLGGFPDTGELMGNLNKGIPPVMNNWIWIYFSLFLVGFIGGLYYQTRNNDEHEMLRNDANYKASDDNFNKVVSQIKKKEAKSKK